MGAARVFKKPHLSPMQRRPRGALALCAGSCAGQVLSCGKKKRGKNKKRKGKRVSKASNMRLGLKGTPRMHATRL